MNITNLNCLATTALLMLLLTMPTSEAQSIPDYVATAISDSSRPATDVARDINRKPAEVIAFAGLKPGDKVADFMPGRGYFTRIFCKIVGDSGHVYAISVPRQTSPASSSASSSSSAAATPPLAPECNNVTSIRLQGINRPAPELHSSSDDPGYVYEYWSTRPAAESFSTPELLDMIWTAENYHDLHNKAFGSPDMLLVNRALLAALKPGGLLIIEDHAAAARSGARDTDTLHRIDRAVVIKELTAAGFEYVGESTALYNKADPHTAKAHEMHDQTDRFLLKFRRP